MASLRTIAVYLYLPLIAMMTIGELTAMELRPSEHGLEYQSLPPTGLKSPQMMSFFGATSSTPSSVALPKAMNSNETAWWGSRRGGSFCNNSNVRHVLLLGSLVCGVTGVALLAASAFVYLTKSRCRSPSSHSSSTATANNTNTNNSLVLITK